MINASTVENIEFLLSIAVLICFFYGPWQWLVIDVLRQNLFLLRDEIFLLAAHGKIGFDSDEYKAVRDRFNAMIRYAHSVSAAHVIAFLLIKPNDNKEFNIMDIAARIPDPDAAKKVLESYQIAMLFTLLAIVTRSLFLLVGNIISAPFFIILGLINSERSKEKLARLGRAIEGDLEAQEQQIRVAA
jgi:hypothetical protein